MCFLDCLDGNADKFNVEAAEKLANEVLVLLIFFNHHLRFRVCVFSPFESLKKICADYLCIHNLFMQRLPISDAVPIYEHLLATFPTSVKPQLWTWNLKLFVYFLSIYFASLG